MKSITQTALAVIVTLLAASPSQAQLDITNFGKGKKASKSVLSPGGAQPSFFESLNPFKNNSTPILTFEKPATAVERFNENTQRVLEQTREAITKPIRDIQEIKLWPNRADGDQDRSFSLVPDWLKSSPNQPQQPTVADWLAQPRPE